MRIKGKKVLLRAIEFEDADLLLQMINDEEIERMMWDILSLSHIINRLNGLRICLVKNLYFAQ